MPERTGPSSGRLYGEQAHNRPLDDRGADRDPGARLQAASCPVPFAPGERVVLGHGGGGALTAELVERLFLPRLGGPALAGLADAAVLDAPGGRIALSTDGFVVAPLRFPGGTIGELAVNGTVNDLAMRGAVPRWLTAGFILEEGLELSELEVVVESMGTAASAAGIEIVAGDTKVVERGRGDGLYVTTAGVGIVPGGVDVGAERIEPGDAVLVSGPIAQHGMAIMSVREGLEFGGEIVSDTAPLHALVAAMLDAAPGAVHALRDPTRGGLATVLHELAVQLGTGIEIEERAVPVPEAVASACALLGLDPLYVPCEGRLAAVVEAARADAVLDAMRAHPQGAGAARIGSVTADRPGSAWARTGIGAARVLDQQVGEQLPRIC